MKRLLAPLAVSLACATQSPVTQKTSAPDAPPADKSTILAVSTGSSNLAIEKPADNFTLQIILMQVHADVQNALKLSTDSIGRLTVSCEMEKRGLSREKPTCLNDLETAKAQFCRLSAKLTAFTSQVEKDHAKMPDESRLILEDIKRKSAEIRAMWKQFFERYFPGNC